MKTRNNKVISIKFAIYVAIALNRTLMYNNNEEKALNKIGTLT
jgi:hypothetical protein